MAKKIPSSVRPDEEMAANLAAMVRLVELQHEGLEVSVPQILRKVINESKNRYKENFKQWEDVYNNASDEDKAVLGALLK